MHSLRFPFTVYTATHRLIQTLAYDEHVGICVEDLYKGYEADDEDHMHYKHIVETCSSFLPSSPDQEDITQKPAFVSPIFVAIFLIRYHDMVMGPAFHKIETLFRIMNLEFEPENVAVWFANLESDIIQKRNLSFGVNETWTDHVPYLSHWLGSYWSGGTEKSDISEVARHHSYYTTFCELSLRAQIDCYLKLQLRFEENKQSKRSKEPLIKDADADVDADVDVDADDKWLFLYVLLE